MAIKQISRLISVLTWGKRESNMQTSDRRLQELTKVIWCWFFFLFK